MKHNKLKLTNHKFNKTTAWLTYRYFNLISLIYLSYYLPMLLQLFCDKVILKLTLNYIVSELICSCVQDDNLKILISNFGRKDWKTIASFLPVSTQLKQN